MRVWSRRLQQAVGALFPKPRSGKVRRLRRTPRRIRRALGEWRNCDVLLEMVAKQQRRSRSEAKRRGWELVRGYLLQKRSKEVARAEKKMLRVDLGDYTALAQRLLDQPPEESPEVLMERLRDSARRAWSKWKNALIMRLDKRDGNYVAQMQNLVLAILNSADQLKANGHPKWKNSIIQTYFPYRGYEPTNQVIQTFNFLDGRGYKIIKK